jgi:transcriptional regulator with XRE-family HTH domain
MEPRERFGANLRRTRRIAGLSQEELSRRCGLHRSEISVLERGGSAPRLGTIIRLAGPLGVGVGRLFAGISWDEDAQRFVVTDLPVLPPRRPS